MTNPEANLIIAIIGCTVLVSSTVVGAAWKLSRTLTKMESGVDNNSRQMEEVKVDVNGLKAVITSLQARVIRVEGKLGIGD